jgi:CDP-diacylglycerol--glycerol-3-phosphate 3-phosphatidyltransferase
MIRLVNLLTVSRVCLGPIIFIILFLNINDLLALFLFFFAGFTDYADGYLARKYDATSQIGEILDPIADKILIIFLLFALSIQLDSYILGFAASIIISREIWVTALRDFNARNNNLDATTVTFLAKVKTTIQLLTISIYLLAIVINNMLLIIFGDIFIVIASLITLYTGYEYTVNSLKKS